jgi:hypothetical protein
MQLFQTWQNGCRKTQNALRAYESDAVKKKRVSSNSRDSEREIRHCKAKKVEDACCHQETKKHRKNSHNYPSKLALNLLGNH